MLIRILLQTILIFYFGLTLFGYFYADKLLFHPHAQTYSIPIPTIQLKTEDGIRIAAVYLSNPTAKYTLLYSHGNGEDLDSSFPRLELLRDMGFSVFSYDYHGYGESGGQPSEASTYADINAAYRYLTEQRHISPKRIVAYGRSLGGGPSADLASRHSLGGLILESTFLSAYRVMIPAPILLFDRFQTYTKLKQIHCPLLVLHGTDDDVVPFWHGESLYKEANQPKMQLWVKGAHHNDLSLIGEQQYEKTIQIFKEGLLK
jgi:abhydrolase domain-containing protein 17